MAFRAVVGFILVAVTGMAYANSSVNPVADFTLKSFSGSNVRLEELRGQVVVLNFWATWCGPCRKEIPELDKMQDTYQPLGVKVIGVNLDSDMTEAKSFTESLQAGFTFLWDEHKRVAKQFNVKAMPSTFIIDKDGTLRYQHKGFQPGYIGIYEEQIKELIRE